MTSKLLFTALGLAALVATPALAKKPVHQTSASGPYASVVAPAQTIDGRAVGTDPDANVRFEMQRDYATSLGAN
jgi:hypothetical protein